MNTLQTKRIALIGGAGFIGHNLALGLKQRGYEVHAIDSLQINNLVAFASAQPALNNRQLYMQMLHERLDLLHKAEIPLDVQDARDYHALSRILKQINPHVIVHLAAVSHANKSNKDPFSTFDHSLRTLENALDCARSGTALERFVYFSSSMVYGNFQVPEVDEEQPLNSIGIYGALKVAGEKIVTAYQQVFDMPYTIIRPSALYGPRCVSRRVGQIFIENAIQGLPLRMEGDGAEKLDFTHIDDMVQGVELSIENPAAKNQVFNMTYGQSRSIRELVDVIRHHFPDLKVQNIERDKLMPFRGTLSIQKAKDLLGYKPQNPIEVGFPKYIEWYRDLLPAQVTA